VVQNARPAEPSGASGLVLAPFSYVPLVDAEVVALFHAVAAASELPICFYNKPVQTGYDKPVQTGYDVSLSMLERIATSVHLAGVKDPARLPRRPSGRVSSMRRAVADTGRDFSIGLSGDVALVDNAEPANAWHTGVAALLPDAYVALRRARIAGARSDALSRPWQEANASRGSLLQLAAFLAALATLRDIIARRP
jgi:4-hydroxy-tetrahydrodipicolinate synthase